jgi:tRNA threonylcarbamoyl adenosine modification protein YjeE
LEQLAAVLAPQLKAGDVVTLDGPLGAGKTTLVQTLGRQLGVQDKIVSPTYVLIHEYATEADRPGVVHVDCYRLGSDGSESIAEELFGIIDAGRTILFVEWAEYAPWLDEACTLAVTLDIELGPNGERRRLTLTPHREGFSLQPLAPDQQPEEA